MDATEYHVKFHFPNAAISLANAVDEDAVNLWSRNLQEKYTFEVRDSTTTYIINPNLVTYMEVRPYHSFF